MSKAPPRPSGGGGAPLRSLFGGPVSTRAECEDLSARAALLAAAAAERQKAEAAAARRAGAGSKAGSHGGGAAPKPPPPPPDPREQKRKKLKSDLDAFDELNAEGPSAARKKRDGGRDGAAGSSGRDGTANGNGALHGGAHKQASKGPEGVSRKRKLPPSSADPGHPRQKQRQQGEGGSRPAKSGPSDPGRQQIQGKASGAGRGGIAGSGGAPSISGAAGGRVQPSAKAAQGPPRTGPPPMYGPGSAGWKPASNLPGGNAWAGDSNGQQAVRTAAGPAGAAHGKAAPGAGVQRANGQQQQQQRRLPGQPPRPGGMTNGGRPAAGAPGQLRGGFYPTHQRPDPRVNTYCDDEDESDDGFVVDDDEAGGEDDWRKEIRKMTGYDPRRFRDDHDDRSMEVGWREMQAEEKRSERMGRAEDDREEQLERRRKEEKVKRKSTKGGSKFFDD